MSNGPPVRFPDIRPCVMCGTGVLCDEGYPPAAKVVHPSCALVTCPHGVVPDVACDECYPEPFREGWTESD